jgi:type I restriction enzyme, R subunit
MAGFAESVVEEAALAWLEALGYAVLHGPDIAVGQPAAERHDPAFRDVLLKKRLRNALLRLNPDLPPEPLEDAYRKLTRAEAPSLIERNRAVHRMLGLQPAARLPASRGRQSGRCGPWRRSRIADG